MNCRLVLPLAGFLFVVPLLAADAGGRPGLLQRLPAVAPGAPDAAGRPLTAGARTLAAALPPALDNPPPAGAVPVIPPRAVTGSPSTLRTRPANGTPAMLSGPLLERAFAGRTRAPGEREQRTAMAFLTARQEQLRIRDAASEWRLVRQETDGLGMHHLRYQQVHGGLDIWPCEAGVHLDRAGNVVRFDGAYIPTPEGVGLVPAIDAADAGRRSRAAVAGGFAARASEPRLVIHGPLDAPPRLAWKSELVLGLRQTWIVVIDAQTGARLVVMNRCLHVADTGVDSFGVVRPLDVTPSPDGGWLLVDQSKPMFDATNGGGMIEVFDAFNRSLVYDSVPDPQGELPPNERASAVVSGTWVPEAVGAAFNLAATYDYFRDVHGRNSLDNEGMSLRALVRVADSRGGRPDGRMANAFWTGAPQNLMVFGNAAPYASALDVVAHELTHGVTEHSAQLIYQFQPGALNEAMSDIFGELIEAGTYGTNDWLVGGHLGRPLRSLKDPKLLGQPSRMREYKNVTTDAGGVHLNSGIINRAFYLLAAGLPGALGRDYAGAIFYRALTSYLRPQSQFIDARHACVAAAEDYFGEDSPEAVRVGQAFDAVELFDAAPAALPSLIPSVNADDSLLFVYYDIAAGGYYQLGRREAGRDSSNGVLLASLLQSDRRPAVSGDGSMAVYVTDNNDLCFRRTDATGRESCLNQAGLVHSVAVSRDGMKYAFVLLGTNGIPSDTIVVYDTRTRKLVEYGLPFPALDGGGIGEIEFADSMTFTADARLLVFDAYSRVEVGGEQVEGFGIYALDLKSADVLAIAPPLPGLNIGNPSLNPVDNTLLVFESHDTANLNSTVMIADLFYGQVEPVLTNYFGWAFPVFNGEGSGLYFVDYSDTADTARDIWFQPLDAGGVAADGEPVPALRDATLPVVYRRGRVPPANKPPSVTLSAPRNGSYVSLPTNLVLRATATDADGIHQVQFFDGARRLGVVSTNARNVFTFNWAAPRKGVRRLTARAVDNWGGSKDSAVTVTVGDRPRIVEPPLGRTVIAGERSVTFRADVTGSQPLKLQWRFNGAAIARATNAVLTITNLATRHAGRYQLYASGPFGTALSAPAQLTVLVPPRLTVQPRSQTLKTGRKLTLSAAATGTAPLSFQWFKDDALIVGANKSTLVINPVAAGDAGRYAVEVANGAGLVRSTNALVTVSP